MPQNCTALDFAFSIHTFLGSHCIGAKVNHKLVLPSATSCKVETRWKF